MSERRTPLPRGESDDPKRTAFIDDKLKRLGLFRRKWPGETQAGAAQAADTTEDSDAEGEG